MNKQKLTRHNPKIVISMCLLSMVKDEKEKSSHNGSSLNALEKLYYPFPLIEVLFFSLES